MIFECHFVQLWLRYFLSSCLRTRRHGRCFWCIYHQLWSAVLESFQCTVPAKGWSSPLAYIYVCWLLTHCFLTFFPSMLLACFAFTLWCFLFYYSESQLVGTHDSWVTQLRNMNCSIFPCVLSSNCNAIALDIYIYISLDAICKTFNIEIRYKVIL